MKKIFALIKKDFLIEASYKLAFFFNVINVFATLIIYFFIDKLFGHKMTSYLQEFGVNYFSYVLLSMAFFSYLGVGISSFSSRIRNEQMQGTLESLFLSPTRISVILLSMGLWNLIFATFDMALYICAGIFCFNLDFSNLNVLSTMIILVLTIVSFSCLGILSASFILVFKKGNPVEWLLNTFGGILGGVYFPVTVMPSFLQGIAKLLPITYAIRALELSVYQGHTVSLLYKEITVLIIFTLLLVPFSLWSFQFALLKTRQQGSLSYY